MTQTELLNWRGREGWVVSVDLGRSSSKTVSGHGPSHRAGPTGNSETVRNGNVVTGDGEVSLERSWVTAQ